MRSGGLTFVSCFRGPRMVAGLLFATLGFSPRHRRTELVRLISSQHSFFLVCEGGFLLELRRIQIFLGDKQRSPF